MHWAELCWNASEEFIVNVFSTNKFSELENVVLKGPAFASIMIQ